MLSNQNSPLVSVVVPNYNYARYLPLRIESILNQTFMDYELILLDDMSTDESVDVLKRYAGNEHVARLVINEENTGSPFKQWMKGIMLSRGKYVWIAEADDLAEPAFLETCVKYAEKYDDFSFAYTGSLLIDAEGNVNRKKDVNKWGKRLRREASCFAGKDFLEHNLYWRNYVLNASAVFFRREYALKLTDSDFINMRYCGDWLFWAQMAMQGGVVEIYRNLNYFRQHESKVTVSADRTGGGIAEGIQIVKQLEAMLPSLDEYKKRLRYGRFYRGIKRASISSEQKRKLYAMLAECLGGCLADYRLERRNQILRIFNPFLITPSRDRLKG